VESEKAKAQADLKQKLDVEKQKAYQDFNQRIAAEKAKTELEMKEKAKQYAQQYIKEIAAKNGIPAEKIKL
jgi:Skp family chaperone for outer membrane proteins